MLLSGDVTNRAPFVRREVGDSERDLPPDAIPFDVAQRADMILD